MYLVTAPKRGDMDKNISDKQITRFSKWAGLILILIAVTILTLVLGDLIKSLLISMSVIFLSLGCVLITGKSYKEVLSGIGYKTAIFSVILYSLWKEDKEKISSSTDDHD